MLVKPGCQLGKRETCIMHDSPSHMGRHRYGLSTNYTQRTTADGLWNKVVSVCLSPDYRHKDEAGTHFARRMSYTRHIMVFTARHD